MDTTTSSPGAPERPSSAPWKLATLIAGVAAAVAIGLATVAVVSDGDGGSHRGSPTMRAAAGWSTDAEQTDWCPWDDGSMGRRMGDSDVWMPNRPNRP